jgi:hypothetical protein
MRKLALAAAAALLAGCGGGGPERVQRTDTTSLDGVRSFLGRAFAERDADVSLGGGLCGDPRLRGEVVGQVPGKLPGCGIANAVRVTHVSGVRLSTGAVVDCPTAQRFADWVDRGAKPSVGRMGGGIESLQVAASYSCRRRNHRPDAPISEHGKGKAIDISAINLADGGQITLIDDWGRGRPGRALASMHGAACGPFGTVLGPESDRFHQDHFHFDTARHGNGPYCR